MVCMYFGMDMSKRRDWMCNARNTLTCSKVNDNVNHKDSVAKAVEGYPASAQVVVEERNRNWQDDQIGHQQEQHTKIPVES